MIRRKLKNVIKNYSECEILVREATSNEAWGPSNSVLSKVAEMSHDEANILLIMPLIWRRLKDKGRRWRHVYKSLLLTIFLVTRGNVNIAECCRKNIHFIESLESFTHTEDNVDIGSRIRKRACELTTLLKDNEVLKIERQKAMITDLRFSKDVVSQGSNVPIKYGNGVNSLSQGPSTGSFISNSENKEVVKPDYPIPSSSAEEDIQLQIALAESKEEAERLQQTEEIKQLTDKYKLNLAIEKNLKENTFENEFDDELWGDKNVVVDTFNDPWSPEMEKRSDLSEPKVAGDIDPWSQNVASNESLWSHSTKPISLDPWSNSHGMKGGGSWSPPKDSVMMVTASPDPWLSVGSTEPMNPWSSELTTESSPPPSHHELSPSPSYNPWSHNQTVFSNPIQRKVMSGGSNDGSMSDFLSDHNHLVNIDRLLSCDNVKLKQMQNNPFLSDARLESYNPFFSDTEEPPVQPETPWPQDVVSCVSQWSVSDPNDGGGTSIISCGLDSRIKASTHYNPFLT